MKGRWVKRPKILIHFAIFLHKVLSHPVTCNELRTIVGNGVAVSAKSVTVAQ